MRGGAALRRGGHGGRRGPHRAAGWDRGGRAGEGRTGRGARTHRGGRAQRRRRAGAGDGCSHLGARSSRTVRRSMPTCTSMRCALDDRARPRFTVRSPWGTTDVELAVSGADMALNAAAAIAAAGTLGVAADVAAAALATATVTEGRMQVLTGAGRSGGRERRLQRQPDLGGGRPRRARRDARPPAGGGARPDGRDRRSARRPPAGRGTRRPSSGSRWWRWTWTSTA